MLNTGFDIKPFLFGGSAAVHARPPFMNWLNSPISALYASRARVRRQLGAGGNPT
jgi:hypothetical protein